MTLIFSLDKHETIKGCKMKSIKKISFFGFVGLKKLIRKIHGIYRKVTQQCSVNLLFLSIDAIKIKWSKYHWQINKWSKYHWQINRWSKYHWQNNKWSKYHW
jgi:hypothetical protein